MHSAKYKANGNSPMVTEKLPFRSTVSHIGDPIMDGEAKIYTTNNSDLMPGLQNVELREHLSSNGENHPETDLCSEFGSGLATRGERVTFQRTKTIMTRFKKKVTVRQKADQVKNLSSRQQEAVVVNETEKRAMRAYLAAEEIMTSEKTYVDVLKILDEFRRSAEETFPENSSFRVYVGGGSVGGQKTFFSVIPTLLELNSHLLEEFEDRIKNWESRRKIADVLVAKAQFLKIYSTYIENFQQSRTLFEKSIKKFPPFSKFLNEFEKRPDCQGLRILSHMLAPIQRIPRYKILLEAYLANQDEGSEDFEDSRKASKIVSSVADANNHSLLAQERRLAMQNLNERVQNKFELIKPGRELLKEARMVNLSIREVPQPWQVVLVTDALIFAYLKVKEKDFKRYNVFFSGCLRRT